MPASITVRLGERPFQPLRPAKSFTQDTTKVSPWFVDLCVPTSSVRNLSTQFRDLVRRPLRRLASGFIRWPGYRAPGIAGHAGGVYAAEKRARSRPATDFDARCVACTVYAR